MTVICFDAETVTKRFWLPYSFQLRSMWMSWTQIAKAPMLLLHFQAVFCPWCPAQLLNLKETFSYLLLWLQVRVMHCSHLLLLVILSLYFRSHQNETTVRPFLRQSLISVNLRYLGKKFLFTNRPWFSFLVLGVLLIFHVDQVFI